MRPQLLLDQRRQLRRPALGRAGPRLPACDRSGAAQRTGSDHRGDVPARSAFKALLETVPGATIDRNSVLPEKIPGDGLIILRDGNPGEPEQALGGFGSTYYQHAVEIEVYLEEGDAAARDAAFDALLQEIGAALETDPTLSGLAFGLTYGRPEPAIEAVAGAPAIKTAALTVTVDYETDAPLA